MPNAHSIWGAPCGANTTHPVSGCNGDGDDTWIGTNESDWADGRKAWQHLSLGGILDKSWPGGSAGSNIIAGVNVPTTVLGGRSGWTFVHLTTASRNAIRLSAYRPPPDDPHFSNHWPAVTTLDAYSLDAKADDGIASTGRVMSLDGSTAGGQCIASGDYRKDITTIACRMFFLYF